MDRLSPALTDYELAGLPFRSDLDCHRPALRSRDVQVIGLAETRGSSSTPSGPILREGAEST
jgi:hypothetical protein